VECAVHIINNESCKESGINIPLAQDQPILNGKSGKPLTRICADLTKDEHDWLWSLVCHAKKLLIEEGHYHRLLRYGWISVNEKDVSLIIRLKKKLESQGLTVIEILDGRYARISTTPSAIFLDEECFCYSLGFGKKIVDKNIEIKLRILKNAIGITKAQSRSIRVPPSVFEAFEYAASIKSGEYCPTPEITRMINEKISAVLKELGLRMLINNKSWCFNVRKESGVGAI
jgi:hypothetical protein